MEPATADPSLLTDTATSDTTGSVGTVTGVVPDEFNVSVVESVGNTELDLVGSVGSVGGDEVVVFSVAVVTGSVELIAVGSVAPVGTALVFEQVCYCWLTSHIKSERAINKWRSVASQGIASLTEIFSCI